jgi:hypothetical protein
VVRSNQEFGRNNSRNGSSNNKARSKFRKRKDIECYKCGKKAHKMRIFREKKDMENKMGLSKSVNVVEEKDSKSDDGDIIYVSSNLDHLTYS